MKLLFHNNKLLNVYADETDVEEFFKEPEYEIIQTPSRFSVPVQTMEKVLPDGSMQRYRTIVDPRPFSDDVAAEVIRIKRNKLLQKSDWTTISDVDLTEAQKNAWKTYRQELRDLPETFANNPNEVVWPTPPNK